PGPGPAVGHCPEHPGGSVDATRPHPGAGRRGTQTLASPDADQQPSGQGAGGDNPQPRPQIQVRDAITGEGVRTPGNEVQPDVLAESPDRQWLASATDGSGFTPLHAATLRGHLPVQKLLLEQGAQTGAKDNKLGWTPLHYATRLGWTEGVGQLLQHKATVDVQDSLGYTPLDV